MTHPSSATTPALQDRTEHSSAVGAVPWARGTGSILRRLHHLRELRLRARRNGEPRSFKLTAANADLLWTLYRTTPGEAKALFPLKKTGKGPALRYWVVPKLIDRWFEELPNA